MAAFVWCPMACGQIAQSHPEFCGLADDANPSLPDVSATIDAAGQVLLYLGKGVMGIPLRDSLIEIAEVCPLSSGSWVVFGDYGATEVFIVDPSKKALVDSFSAWYPVISPNQRWIAFVKAFPLHGVNGSDQYLLYDLTKSPAENRPDGNVSDLGRVIFPPGHENYPGSNIDLPESQQHLGGRRIYWAPDSRAIAFEDRIVEGPGVVVVTLNDNGIPSALRHALTPAELCGRNVTSNDGINWRLAGVDFALDGVPASAGLALDIDAAGGADCVRHTLHLQKASFLTAKIEANARPTPTRGVIYRGRVVVPPKQK